jgi:hypothetical protein
MKKTIFRTGAGTIAAITVTVFVAAIMAIGQSADAKGGGRLEGSWDVRVSVLNCQTGAVIRSFDSVTQFMTGGTLIDSTSGVPQALKTPGEGIWEHTTDSSYRFKIKSFGFDASGNYTGYTIIKHEATLDEAANNYESAGTAEIYAPSGVLLATLCSSTAATRIVF